MKLNVFGNPFGESGYAIHTTNLVKALQQEGLKTGLEVMSLPQGWEFTVPIEVKKAIEEESSYWATLMISLPDSWTLKSGDRCKPLIGFGVFEGTKVPVSWKINSECVDEIWVPSEHTKKAFEAAGITKHIEIIPHGFDETIFTPEGIKEEEDDKFRFLFVGGWKDGEKDRKGLDIALRAFCSEFSKLEKVKFTGKLNMVYQGEETLKQNLMSLGLPAVGERPEIEIIMENTTLENLAVFYRSSDCLVMPSKAEGFGMSGLEAVACEVPVIASDFGGQTDYLVRENLFIETEKMIPATGEPWIYSEAEWALPSQKDLQKKMRFAFENQELIKKWAVEDSQKVLETMTWHHTARKAINRLKKLDAEMKK